MWVSMVLTSQAHRRRTPKKNRRIPTIPTGRVDGWIVHVSAVDTGPRRSESAGFLVAQPGAVAVWNHRHSCLRPCVVCRTQPRHLGPITRHQRHDLKHRALSGARAKARRSWFNAGSAPSRPESVYSTRVGIY